MHKRLQEPSRKHENNEVGIKLNDASLAAGWYRIFGQAGNRLLDINDLPKNVSKEYVVRLILFSIYVNDLVTLRQIFFPYSELQPMMKILIRLKKLIYLTKFINEKIFNDKNNILSFQKSTLTRMLPRKLLIAEFDRM